MLHTSEPRLSRSRIRRYLFRLAAGVLALNLLIGCIAYIYLEQRYDYYRERARLEALNLSRVLSGNVSGLLHKIDVALHATELEVSRLRRTGQLKEETITPYLNRMAQWVPESKGFRVVTANGSIQFASGDFRRNQNIADREYFQKLKNRDDGRLLISKPYLGRAVLGWSIMVARRINDADGRFDGIVYAVLSPERLSDSFKLLSLREHGVVVLRNSDLVILARHPIVDAQGQSTIGRVGNIAEPLSALRSGLEETSYESLVKLDGVERILGFTRIKDYPELNIAVGIAKDSVLADWGVAARMISAGTLVCSLFSLISAYLLWRNWYRREISHLKLAWQEARLRIFAEASADWFWELNDHRRFAWLSPGMETKSGLAPELLLGRGFEEINQEADEESLEFLKSRLDKYESFTDWILPALNAHGQSRYQSLSGAPVVDGNGIFLGYMGAGKDVTAKIRAERKMQHRAFHDALTELPNRSLFEDRLRLALLMAQRKGGKLGVLFVDLDKFKPINDRLGHFVGDIVLVEVARRMRAAVRSSDTVARLGGDEFIVLLPFIADLQAALQVAEKIRAALNEAIEYEGGFLEISSSTGIAIFPEHGDAVEVLMAHADKAMYAAKQAGRNTVYVFDSPQAE